MRLEASHLEPKVLLAVTGIALSGVIVACSQGSTPTEPAPLDHVATGEVEVSADAQPGKGRGGGGGGGGTDPDFEVTLSGTGGYSSVGGVSSALQASRDNNKSLDLEGLIEMAFDFELPYDGVSAGCAWTEGYSWNEVQTGSDFASIRATLQDATSVREVGIVVNKRDALGGIRSLGTGSFGEDWFSLGFNTGLGQCGVTLPADDDPTVTRIYTFTNGGWRSVDRLPDSGPNESIGVACPFIGVVEVEVAPAS
jgi:hypothetical protein